MAAAAAGPGSGAPATARGRQTRSRLLAATAEVVGERGLEGASVGAIADRAGVSAGALYRHFPSKTDLLSELFRLVAERELEAMHAAGEGAGSYLERLDAVLGTYGRRALANPRLAWSLLYEPVEGPLAADRLAYRRRYSDELSELIGLAIEAGEIPDQDPELSAAALVGAIAEALLGPISPVGAGSDPDPELVLSRLLPLCRRALGAPDPR